MTSMFRPQRLSAKIRQRLATELRMVRIRTQGRRLSRRALLLETKHALHMEYLNTAGRYAGFKRQGVSPDVLMEAACKARHFHEAEEAVAIAEAAIRGGVILSHGFTLLDAE